jgi:hypothetical protein
MWLGSSVMWAGMYQHFGGTCYLCPEVRRVCFYGGLTVTWSVRNAAKPCGSGGGTEGAVTSPTLLDVPTSIAVSIYKTNDVTSHGTCSVPCHIQTHSQCTMLKSSPKTRIPWVVTFLSVPQTWYLRNWSWGGSNPWPPRYTIILWVKYTNACCFYTCSLQASL